MKVTKLQFLNRAINVGVQAAADSTSHDISLFPGGYYLLEHRQSGRAYLVHASLAVAEVDVSEDGGNEGGNPDMKPAKKLRP